MTDAKGTVIGVVKTAPDDAAPPSTPGTASPAPAEVVTLRRELASMAELQQRHVETIEDLQNEMKGPKESLERLTRRPP